MKKVLNEMDKIKILNSESKEKWEAIRAMNRDEAFQEWTNVCKEIMKAHKRKEYKLVSNLYFECEFLNKKANHYFEAEINSVYQT